MPFPSPGDLPDPGTKPMSLRSPALTGRFFTPEPPGKLNDNDLAMQETWVWSLGQEDPLEKEMATCASILAWEIPWTESGRL